MIRCRISQRLLSSLNSGIPAAADQQVNDSISIEEAGAAPAPAALRCPRLVPKSSAQNSRAGKQDPQRGGNWLLSLCNRSSGDEIHVENGEHISFHLATFEASCSGGSSEEDLFISEGSSSREEEEVVGNDPIIRNLEEPEVKSPSQMLDSDMVSAIKNVVNDAVGSFTEDFSYRDDPMDSIADDLLSELERAATQVAGMEAEIKSLKERVQDDEVRRSHLEEELAFHKEADKLAASVSRTQNNSTEQARCTSGRNHCSHSSEQLTSYEQRLAFLEDVCSNKDATIMELEQEISNLQTKLSDLFKNEQQQQQSSPPATIKELLVKLGSDHQSTRSSSELRESESTAKKKLVGKKSSRKNNTSNTSGKNILVDLAPNLLDRTGLNPAKKLKF